MIGVRRAGKLACLANLREEGVPIAFRVYLDSSGKPENSYMTLAAFAGPGGIWGEFEARWEEILHGHVPRAEYVHMNELIRQIDGFDRRFGWTPESSWGLVWKCLDYMQRIDKKRFRMFYCAIDLAARRKLMAETYQIPDPIELCNEWCSEMVMKWYLGKYPDVICASPSLYYFFDRGEPFYRAFKGKWNAEVEKLRPERGDWSIWNFVAQVSAVEMRKVPGVQAADILAWGVNRENSVPTVMPGTSLPHIMRTVIPSGHIVWDEEKMRKTFRPLIVL